MEAQTVVLRGMSRLIAILLVAVLAVPCRSYGAAKLTSLAVTAVHDGKNDTVADELAAAIAGALKQSRTLRVVDGQAAGDVISYGSNSTNNDQNISGLDDETLNAAAADLRLANEAFFKFRNKQAVKHADQAVKLLEGSATSISRKGRLLADACLTRALIGQAMSDDRAVRSSLQRLLAIDPSYVLDEKAYPPSLRRTFDQLRGVPNVAGSGTIHVDSTPRSIEVALNGINKGMTPIDITGLPAGRYQIALSANNYRTIEKEIELKEGAKATIKESIKWGVDKKRTSSTADPAGLVADGVRIGSSLKLDKVVYVDVDEKRGGAGSISVQMVDVRYKAGLRPIVIEYGGEREGMDASLSEMVSRIIDDAMSDPARDPSGEIDPLGVNDPVLIGESAKQRRLTTKQLLMIIGGAVLVAGGATAAALLIGDSPDKGGLHVQFKFK